MGRSPCCDKTKVKRGPWSPEEDSILRNHIHNHGTGGNWISLPHKAGLKRCGKSCRLRWLNYLRPDIKLGGFTDEEDNIILSLYSNIGSRWSVIASHLQGRTDNDVKNHWNTKLKKKLIPCHNSTNPKMQSTSPILPKQEVDNNLQIVDNNLQVVNNNFVDNYYVIADHNYLQQQPMISSSGFNVNYTSSSQENNHSGFNEYATNWSENSGEAIDDIFTGFDLRQMLGEVANFNYSSSLSG